MTHSTMPASCPTLPADPYRETEMTVATQGLVIPSLPRKTDVAGLGELDRTYWTESDAALSEVAVPYPWRVITFSVASLLASVILTASVL